MAGTLFAEEARLLRYPDVHKGKIAFVYAGDIYLILPESGGQAIRLTSHEGFELFPKFSPDGRHIAFTGQYDGDMSVYYMPVEGGQPKRLTYHPGMQKLSERMGPENMVMGWHPDGKRILFRSRKEASDAWDGRAYLIDTAGGLPVPLPMSVAGLTSFSPDAKYVAYCPIFREFRTWKRYKGGMAQDIWIFNLESYEAEKITDWIGTDHMAMWYGNKIYFNSDRTGTLNLHYYDIKTGDIHQVTWFTDFDVRWPSLGPDCIAFENGGYIHILELPTETVRKVEIQLATDQHQVRPQYEKVSDKIVDYDISPNGKRAALRARGDIFTAPAKEGNIRNITNRPQSSETYPRWSPDGKWIAYFSDITGEEELYITSHDARQTVQLTTGADCHRFNPAWSPDSKKLVFSDKNLKLYYVDIETKQPVQFDKSDRDEVRHFSWSPDSRYISYSKRLKNRIETIWIYSLVTDTVHQATPGLTNDSWPVFDTEGKYLYFLSERNFNPILGSYEFSFVNKAIKNLFLIVLDKDQASPFAPVSDEADAGDDNTGGLKTRDDEKEKKKPVEITIDFDGIFDRQVAFDLSAGEYDSLSAVPGALFYFSSPIKGLRGKVTQDEPVLHKYDLEKRKDYSFLSGIKGYRISAGHDRMIVSKDKGFYIVETKGEKVELKESKLDLSSMEMLVDRKTEYVQMFNQVWRRFRDFFYDKNMHGVDWKKMRDRYKVLLPYVSHRYDFTYVLGEMAGELCCSHTYVGGGDLPKVPSAGIGLFGVDFEIDRENNRIRIKRILDGENWDEKLRSPLLEPGIEVNEGDYLLAIDGKEITADVNPYALMVNTVGRQVILTVNGKPEVKGAREVTIKPVDSEVSLRYYNRVEKSREYVDSISGGQIGYVHIPDMGGFGLVRFTKMFYNQIRKPGLIIDVRYNGGGFVSGLMLERLRRVVKAMWASRNMGHGPTPGDGLNAHMITLMNEFSCSDGDYFPYFFRAYGLGPLLGRRSWGGVNGFNSVDRLADGGFCIVPEFGIYNLDGEWVLENVGVEPDIEVSNTPDRTALGYDDQLDEALRYVMDKLKTEPKTLPRLPGPPAER
jgi:tricorn protease